MLRPKMIWLKMAMLPGLRQTSLYVGISVAFLLNPPSFEQTNRKRLMQFAFSLEQSKAHSSAITNSPALIRG